MRQYAIAGTYLEFMRWVREDRKNRSGVIYRNRPEPCEDREPGVLHRIGNWQASPAFPAALKLEKDGLRPMGRAGRKARRAKKKRLEKFGTPSDLRIRTAQHEAAHAVVAVRLGLPLASTDIEARVHKQGGVLGMLKPGETVRSSGITLLEPQVAERAQAALPDPHAKSRLRDLAAMAAAGAVAELHFGGNERSPEHQNDIRHIAGLARALGIGGSTEEPAVQQFINESFDRAGKILYAPERDDWYLVTNALLERGALSGDEVKDLLPA